MLRIFPVPSHLTYVAKLAGQRFAPVPSPVGRPLRLGELVAFDSWGLLRVLPPPAANDQALRTCRAAEHLRFLDAHYDLYFGSRPEEM